jgi:GxxExxY protein
LGPGLLESIYERCLSHELSLRKIPHQTQVEVPVEYKETKFDCGLRLDILIPGKLIVELKACEKLMPIHNAQLLTYMKLAEIKAGLLINFNIPLLKDGIKRLLL